MVAEKELTASLSVEGLASSPARVDGVVEALKEAGAVFRAEGGGTPGHHAVFSHV